MHKTLCLSEFVALLVEIESSVNTTQQTETPPPTAGLQLVRMEYPASTTQAVEISLKAAAVLLRALMYLLVTSSCTELLLELTRHALS